jgi:hypothetical protein
VRGPKGKAVPFVVGFLRSFIFRFQPNPHKKIVNKDQYPIKEEIGKVKFKVDKDSLPKQNFLSNSLEVGTPIYSVKEDKSILLMKLSDEKYWIFSEKAIEN